MMEAQRLDRWLWFARFFKSRTLAARMCAGHKVRINRNIVTKASATVKAGDVLTFPQGHQIRVIRIVDLGVRRGPASEAQMLYEDLTPPSEAKQPEDAAPAERPRGSGRPTKRERRDLERLRSPAE